MRLACNWERSRKTSAAFGCPQGAIVDLLIQQRRKVALFITLCQPAQTAVRAPKDSLDVHAD